MIKNKQTQELAWLARDYFYKLIGKGFTHSQITVIYIMIFIDEYSKSKGPSSARIMMLGLLNNIITGSDLDLNKFIENCDAKVSFKRIDSAKEIKNLCKTKNESKCDQIELFSDQDVNKERDENNIIYIDEI